MNLPREALMMDCNVGLASSQNGVSSQLKANKATNVPCAGGTITGGVAQSFANSTATSVWAIGSLLAIVVARRSDGSGTNAIFTDYLSKVSPEFKNKVGSGTSVNWPVGLGGKGNDGVTGLVKSTPGAIGYVELAYALQQKLAVAELKNKDGQWVKASIESTTAAAAGVEMPADYRVSITNAPGKDAYPIAGFTWLLVHRDSKDAAKGTAIVNFLRWAITDGEKMAAPLDYAPLPRSVQERVLKSIDTLTVNGAKISAK